MSSNELLKSVNCVTPYSIGVYVNYAAYPLVVGKSRKEVYTI